MLKQLLSKRAKAIKTSDIGEIAMAFEGSQHIISFATGVPDQASYQVSAIQEATIKALETEGTNILGYVDPLGDYELRRLLAERTASLYGISALPDQVLIASGATQAIDICCQAFFDEGDTVLIENPSYIDAINSLAFNSVTVQGVASDDEGMDLEDLKAKLEQGAKAIYVIPNFQNPTGRHWSLARRKAFMDLVAQYPVVVFEDDPYGELYFGDAPIPPLVAFDKNHQVIYMASLSKLFCPGLRLAMMLVPEPALKTITTIKEKMDLHTSSLDQAIFRHLLVDTDFESHVASLRQFYSRKGAHMVQALRQYAPELTFTEPQGGFFIWAKLPAGLTGDQLLAKAIPHEVVFVLGRSFYAHDPDHGYIRLAFSGVTLEEIDEGVQRLGKALRECLVDHT